MVHSRKVNKKNCTVIKSFCLTVIFKQTYGLRVKTPPSVSPQAVNCWPDSSRENNECPGLKAGLPIYCLVQIKA